MKQTPLADVANLDPASRQILQNAGVTSAEELWAMIAEKPTGLDALPFQDAAARMAVAEAIVAHAIEAAKRLTAPPLTRYIPDALLLVALIAGIVALVRKDIRQPPVPLVSGVSVAAENGIEPFRVITGGDVKVVSGGGPSVSVSDVVGRYALERLKKDAPLDPASLGSFKDMPGLIRLLDSLSVLQVAFDADASLLGLTPPVEIAMVVPSDGANTKGMLVEHVYVLRIQQAADHIAAVVGMSPDALRALAPLMRGAKMIPVVVRR